MPDQTRIARIIEEVFSLDSPRIDASRRDQVSTFITSTVNGDQTIHAHLVLNAGLGQNRTGALVYILTNLRLIKVEIDERNVQSSSPSLSTLVNVDRKLMDGNKISVSVIFQNDFFGLTYSSTGEAITDFFQQVDQARVKGQP
jgi:hypothetical protein